MNILIFIPVYKRPEVLRICLNNLTRFSSAVSWDVEVVCLLSPEDKYLKQNQNTVKRHGFKAIYYPNIPVSDKMNAGIQWIMNHCEFDYMMNFGSDDLIHPDIEVLYEPFIKAKHQMFGINTLYFYELSTKRTCYFCNYNYVGSIGAGRMIHYDILKWFAGQSYPVYEPGLNRGLDTSSAMTIKRLLNRVDVVAPAGKFPYIVDIKTDTNINTMFEIGERSDCITECKTDYLNQYYDI